MKKPFKVGERVRVFKTEDEGLDSDAFADPETMDGIIEGIGSKGTFRIRHGKDGDYCFWAHPKQCRRLIPKKNPRKRIWMYGSLAESDAFSKRPSKGEMIQYTEFIEVKKK